MNLLNSCVRMEFCRGLSSKGILFISFWYLFLFFFFIKKEAKNLFSCFNKDDIDTYFKSIYFSL